jgi:hypothetical protein
MAGFSTGIATDTIYRNDNIDNLPLTNILKSF